MLCLRRPNNPFCRLCFAMLFFHPQIFFQLGLDFLAGLQRRKIYTFSSENRSYLKALFRVVENGDFFNRLRNGHLEKSVVTGICRPSRSPATAKTPLKVHLRLRFQNLGKPRTAGLCGRAAGACDCGPLSCAKIERPSPPRKPSCKVRLFAQIHFHEYRQKVTVTTLFQTTSHRTFQLLTQTPHVRFHE